MSKQVRIEPVHRSDVDVDRLAQAFLDLVEQLDEPTLAALVLDGQREIARLGLPKSKTPRGKAAA